MSFSGLSEVRPLNVNRDYFINHFRGADMFLMAFDDLQGLHISHFV